MSDIPILTLDVEKTQINLLDEINKSVDVIQKSSLNFFSKKEDQLTLLDAHGKKVEKKEEIKNKKDDQNKKEEKEELKKRNTFLEKLTTKLQGIGNETVNVLNTTKDNLIKGIAGPFRLLLDPIKELTGFDFFGKLSEGTKIKQKTNPTKQDLSKTEDGQATLYEENQRKKDKTGKDKDSKILGFFPAGFKTIGKVLLKALPIAAIAGGIIWSVFDGIQGAIKAGQFGGTKISGFIAGFLAGTGKGWKNAFKNAGKLALIGAGTGFLVAGPVGALVGGLIGAALGGILGYIGQEKVTKGLDKLGAMLKENIFDGLFAFFIGIKDAVVKPFKDKKNADKSITFKIGAALGALVKFLGKTVIDIFKSKGKFGAKGATIGFAMGSIPGALLGGMIGLAVDGIVKLFKTTKTDFTPDMSVGDIVKEKIGKVFGFLGNIVTEFLDGLTGGKFSEAKEAIKEINPFGQIKEFIIDMKNSVVSFFTFIGDFFGFLQEGFKAKNILGFIGTIAKGEFGEEFAEFRDKREEERGIVDNSFAIMNEEMKKANQKKSEVDILMLKELQRFNEKKEETPTIIQNNVSDNTFNPNAIRTTLQYLNQGTL